MKRKLIVLAVSGLISGASCAQSNVTVYGRIDYGFMNRGGGSGALADPGTKNEFGSGIQSGSRLGFKGMEDIGNGWKALFETEFQLNMDSADGTATTATNQFWNRHSYIALNNAGYGTFIGGRVDGPRYTYTGKYDPFAGGTVGNFASIAVQQTRGDNAVAYISPSFGGGFSVLAAYSNNLTGQEAANNAGDISLWALAGMYDNGPISAVYDHEEGELDGLDGKLKVNVLGGSYDFGTIKLSGYWEKVKTEGALAGALPWDQKAYYIGLTAPVAGNGKIKFLWGKVDDKLNNAGADVALGTCRKIAVGFDYALSKRTNLYTDFAKITNEAGATCSIATAGTGNSLDSSGVGASGVKNTGYGTRGFDIGIAHTF
ncbi:MAG TPA: porin [Rhodocyclaceae bacterium]